jgi:hypothetical protein
MLVRRLWLKPKAKKVSLGYLGQPTDFPLSINHVLTPHSLNHDDLSVLPQKNNSSLAAAKAWVPLDFSVKIAIKQTDATPYLAHPTPVNT